MSSKFPQCTPDGDLKASASILQGHIFNMEGQPMETTERPYGPLVKEQHLWALGSPWAAMNCTVKLSGPCFPCPCPKAPVKSSAKYLGDIFLLLLCCCTEELHHSLAAGGAASPSMCWSWSLRMTPSASYSLSTTSSVQKTALSPL